MKLYRNIICVVLVAIASAFTVGCSDDGVDNREHNYGYAQFKLYKEASYTPSEPSSATRAVQDMLDYLSDACKIKVTLVYDGVTIAQTLTLATEDAENVEYGLRSDKIKLLVGHYDLKTFSLYNALDELI